MSENSEQATRSGAFAALLKPWTFWQDMLSLQVEQAEQMHLEMLDLQERGMHEACTGIDEVARLSKASVRYAERMQSAAREGQMSFFQNISSWGRG